MRSDHLITYLTKYFLSLQILPGNNETSPVSRADFKEGTEGGHGGGEADPWLEALKEELGVVELRVSRWLWHVQIVSGSPETTGS